MTDTTAIDRYLEAILCAAGSHLRHYTPGAIAKLREAMVAVEEEIRAGFEKGDLVSEFGAEASAVK